MASLLIDYGAHIRVTDINNETPSDIAGELPNNSVLTLFE
jgi:hypothetical protein